MNVNLYFSGINGSYTPGPCGSCLLGFVSDYSEMCFKAEMVAPFLIPTRNTLEIQSLSILCQHAVSIFRCCFAIVRYAVVSHYGFNLHLSDGSWWASQVAQWSGIHLPKQETRVQSLGWEDPLEEGMATQSSVLAWRIPWTEEPGGLQSMGSQRVRRELVTKRQ